MFRIFMPDMAPICVPCPCGPNEAQDGPSPRESCAHSPPRAGRVRAVFRVVQGGPRFAPSFAAMQMKKILVPIDTSDPSRAGLRLAIALAQQDQGTVTALYVDTDTETVTRTLTEHGRYVDAGRVAAHYLRSVGAAVEAWVQETPGEIRAEVEIIDDRNADEAIVRFAAENDFDLICMSAFGKRGWQKLFLGSTAAAVVRRSPIPVLTIRKRDPRADDDQLYQDFRKVLVSVDLGEGSADVLRAGIALAVDAPRAELVLAHVIPVPLVQGLYGAPLALPAESLGAAEEWSEVALRKLLKDNGVDDACVRVVCDRAGHGILELERSLVPDVTVVGTHGRHGLDRLALGSVAEHVIRAATGPVLTVPVRAA